MMTDYERQARRVMGLEVPSDTEVTGLWDNYVTPTGPSPDSKPQDSKEWGDKTDVPVDWKKVAHEERMKIWREEEEKMDDEASVKTFDSALEEESRVESSREMLARIDWVERNGVQRTLHPINNSSHHLAGCDPKKITDEVYLEKMIKHEGRKVNRLEEEIGFFRWKLNDLGRLRKRLEVRETVNHLQRLNDKLKLASAKKKIWIDYWNKID